MRKLNSRTPLPVPKHDFYCVLHSSPVLSPGQTYRLSFRVKGDVSTSVALIFTVGASAIDTSTVDDGRVKVGYFVAAESSGTLAVSLFGKEDPAKSLLDGVRITPGKWCAADPSVELKTLLISLSSLTGSRSFVSPFTRSNRM